MIDRTRRSPPRPTVKEAAMWYFSWILGIGVALGFGIINAMWLEASGTVPVDEKERSAARAAMGGRRT
jgi:cyd operon protein YbgT